MLKEPKNLANLGDGCYVQSKMLSTGIYLHLGFGFHVEVDLVSAEVYSNSRVEILKRKAEFAHTELIEVKADYEEVC